MTSFAKELWEKALRELSNILGESTILKFFGLTEGLTYIDNCLSISIPADADAVMLQQSFNHFILNALRSSGAPEGVTFKFIVNVPKPEVAPVTPLPQTQTVVSSDLSDKFTFDTFVEGPSNQFPLAMAKYVAQHPGDDASHTNPLFMYGPTGVGKTHLLHAIGNLGQEVNPKLRVVYVTCEQLLNEYIGMWNTEERKQAFRNKYRNPDMLLVDDIQFISKKHELQQEFFNIFNELTSNQRQIVMVSDCAPKDIQGIMERLVSRFQSGICADIDIPAYETRFNIIKLKLKDYPYITLPNEIIDFLAKRVTTSVRALEGALASVINYARILPNGGAGVLTTEVLEKSILKDIISQQESMVQLSCSDIIQAVCKKYNLSQEDILGSSKLREVVIPRQIAMYLCRKLTPCSTPDIGKAFKRQHPTIIHNCTTIQGLYKSKDPSTVAALHDLVSALNRSTNELN